MTKTLILLLTLGGLSSFAQSIETITEKISNKICDCINDDIESYAEIKPEFNRCYDLEFNQIYNLVDTAEHKILVQQGALQKVKEGIIPTLNSSCNKIRNLIQNEVESSVEPTTNSKAVPCPTNFTGKDLNKIKKLDGEIVAFNCLVTEVHTAHNDKPYYQVKLEGGNTIWIASLVNSGYEKEGRILGILGYVSEVGNDEIAEKYNKGDYHILAFCIIEMDKKQMAMLPGSELQVKEWMDGKIPIAENK